MGGNFNFVSNVYWSCLGVGVVFYILYIMGILCLEIKVVVLIELGFKSFLFWVWYKNRFLKLLIWDLCFLVS